MRLLRSFFSTTYTVRKATALLALTALLSNVLGLLRNVIFYRFVPPEQLDIYYASFRLPDLLFNILILGAISSAFIPVISDLLGQAKKPEAWKVSNQVISWLTLSFGLLAILLFFLMPNLMQLIVPSFSPDRFDQTVFISRILLLQSIFFAWSWSFGGLLNSFNRFGSYALAPLLYNGTIIIGGLFGARFGITGIAVSVVIGSILHMSIQFREVWLLGYRPKIDLSWGVSIQEIARLMIPRSLSQGMGQFVLIIYTALGSGLTAGSIAIFSGMNDLQSTPTVIVANSLAVAFFPTLSAHAGQKNWDEVSRLTTKVVKAAIFLLIPTILVTYILRAQIVRLYFGIGGASWELTNMAIQTFTWFLVGIIPAALIVILGRVFYAYKDTKTPLLLSTAAGAVGIVFAIAGIKLGNGNVSTLATATALTAWVQASLYLIHLYRHDHFQLGMSELLRKLGSYVIGGLLAAFLSWIALHTVNAIYNMVGLSTRTVAGLVLQFGVALIVGLFTYLTYSKYAHQEELQWLQNNAFSKLK